MRRLLNRSVDGLFMRPLAPLWARRLRGRILCLVYHRVTDDPPDFLAWGGVPTMSSGELRRDIELIKGLGGRFMTLRDLREGVRPDADAPNFIVTFDDGLRDTYENGLAVLDEQGVKGVVFQIGELLEGVRMNWEHNLYWSGWQAERSESLAKMMTARLRAVGAPERRSGMSVQSYIKLVRDTVSTERLLPVIEAINVEMDDEQDRREAVRRLYPRPTDIRAAADHGHEIGSHGLSHMPRRFLADESFRQDVTEAATVIGKAAGWTPEAYAYPFGCRESRDRDILSAVYRQTVTTFPAFMSVDQTFDMNRCPWPGPARNKLRRRRWLLTGRI